MPSNRKTKRKGNIMLLGVNIDHIATVRNARHDLSQPRGGGTGCRNARCRPDYHAPARRPPPHQRRGCICRQNAIRTRLNLEMALTEEMLENALKVMPEDVCIVPENGRKSRPKAVWTYWRNRKNRRIRQNPDRRGHTRVLVYRCRRQANPSRP